MAMPTKIGADPSLTVWPYAAALVAGWEYRVVKSRPQTAPITIQITKNKPMKIMLRRLLLAISLYM